MPNSRSSSTDTSPLCSNHDKLRRREVRVEDQARGAADHRFVAGRAQLVAALGGAPVLPDDRARTRRAGRAVPDHHRLALVRDADRGDRLARFRDLGARRRRVSRPSRARCRRRRARPIRGAGSAAETRGTTCAGARRRRRPRTRGRPVVPASIAIDAAHSSVDPRRSVRRRRRRQRRATAPSSRADRATADGRWRALTRRRRPAAHGVVVDDDPVEPRMTHAGGAGG